ncbi:hypothetical protein [Pontiella sulfatireligans]|nr:hypothetical protein [Pontiella sulfatireligans]
MAFSSIKSKKAALLLVLGLVALAAGSAQAAVYTWTGDETATGNDYADWNYDNNWGGTAPTFVNTDDIKIAGTATLDQYIRTHRTIRSLEFTSSNTGATQIGFIAANGADRDLTFSADTGNSSLTVDASASGDKTLGSFEGSVTPGEVVLLSNLDVTHNGTGNLTFACEIRGAGNLNVAGSGTTVFSGTNTYTGNTTVDGALTLSEAAQLAFTIGTNGVNNALSGSGAVSLDGDFLLDLTGAGRTLGDSWQIVDVDTLMETFGATFSLASTAGSFTETNGVWSISENGAGYEFSENTGLLTVVTVLPAAHWMSGEWGIGWRFRADDKTQIANWDVDTLVSQVKSIPGVNHVIFNLSDAAHGDAYIAPHSVLTAINPGSTPDNDRDLFMEMAQGFQTNGIKVIAYVAAQGPAMLKHGAEAAYDSVEVSSNVYTSVAMDNWSNYVYGAYNIGDFADEREMYKRAFGEVILDEYAARYGRLIDGWWFDNGAVENFDAELLFAIAKQYNPNCVVSTSAELSLQSDYLSGHPTPLASYPANDLINLPMLTAIEAAPDGYLYKGTQPNLGHMFMALGTAWNSGAIVWPLDQAADWMTRCLNAGGSWTWNVDLTDADSILRADSATFLTDLIAERAALAVSNVASPIFSQDTYDGGNAKLGVAYTGSLAGSATDADGDTVTYAIAPGGPDWLVASTNGTLSGTPYNTWDLGTNRFTLVAADGKGRIDLAELEIYVTDESGSDIPHFQISFDNLRGNLSDGTIHGLPISDPNVSITKATNGNDVVYSLSIINQDLDNGGTFTDSLSWDIRVAGFSNRTYNVNSNDSSVTLGSSVPVGTINNEFGISGGDNSFINPGESVQFSVENIVLTADAGFSTQFDGFSGLWGTKGTYIYGEGASGLESQVTTNNGALTFVTNTVLVVTSTSISERIRDLDGSFTVLAAVPAVTNASFTIIQDGGQDYPGMTYTRVITPGAYLIETSTNLITSSWILRSVGPAESDLTIVSGPVDNADGTETLSFRLNQGLDANSSLFIRINGTE